MKITKYGHCCLLVEEGGVRLLTDPGAFTAEAHASLTNINIVLYTHEHADHFHLESLKELLIHSPSAEIVCNTGVSALLHAENIPHTTITDGTFDKLDITLRGVSGTHAEIHSTIPQIQNTGFMIADKLWYPGDAFIDPNTKVEILALPVAGPWMKLSEAIDYALALKPAQAFPVHDMILHPQFASFVPRIVGGILEKNSVGFQEMELQKAYDI